MGSNPQAASCGLLRTNYFMIKLKLENKNHSSTAQNPPIYINDIVKSIKQDENLATNLESSSLLWKVTIPHDDANIPTIINEEEWKAELYYEWEDEETHIIYTETYFTGYLSDSVSWVIDQNGQSALQVTLEDNGVHLLKKPYTKDESEVISGKFSSIATGDLGVVQRICNKAGISYVSNIITDTTLVECVADPAESCESLLKSVCKEFCVAYSFNTLGQLYLIPLSHTDVEHEAQEELDDTDIYDSINLSKKTVTYKGSRIEWDDLADISHTLVYRDITKPSNSTAPDCYIQLSQGDTYPSRDGALTYIKACDIVRGAEVFSITNLDPEISWAPGAGTTDSFRIYGANEIEVKITCTSSGTINKLQAYADLRYVKSKNVVYGKYNTDTPASITEALREETCRWIHSSTPAEKYANFLAQYDRYCNRTFTFKARATYDLGQVIHLHENVHTGLAAYLMITKRTRTLTGFDTTTRTFTGIWTYEAVSMSNFDFSQGVTTENLWVPPSTSYVDVSNIEGKSFTLSADKSTLTRDNHSSSNQTLTITSNISGDVGTIVLSGSFNDGTTIPVDPSPSITGPYIHVDTAGIRWEIRNIPEDTQYTTINVHGAETNGSLTYDLAVSFLNKTETFFFGALASDPAASVKRVTGDYYLNTTDGTTYEWNGTTWVACEDADKLLEALHTARHQNPPIDFNAAPYQNANTVSWFNTILAAKGIIDQLFSHEITLLDPGYIKSSNYSPASQGNVCTETNIYLEYDPDMPQDATHPESFSVDADIFVNNTWGYGTYVFTCTRSYNDNPHSSEGDDDGEWKIELNGVTKATTNDCASLANYGIYISFTEDTNTLGTDDYFTITSSYQLVQGSGFYLGSDGTFNCNSSNMYDMTANNSVITGNSIFSGSFDCGAIRTAISNPTPISGAYATANTSQYSWQMNQASTLRTDISNILRNISASAPFACEIQDTNGNTILGDIFVKLEGDGGGHGDRYLVYRVAFIDAAGNLIDLRTLSSLGMINNGYVEANDVKKITANWAQRTGYSNSYSCASNSFRVQLMQGGNTIEFNLPSSSSGLTSGMAYRDSSGYLRIV